MNKIRKKWIFIDHRTLIWDHKEETPIQDILQAARDKYVYGDYVDSHSDSVVVVLVKDPAEPETLQQLFNNCCDSEGGCIG